MTYLIDTDWVIDFLLDDIRAVLFLGELRPAGVAISVVTYMEVVEGLEGGRNRLAAKAGFDAFLRDATVLAVTEAEARCTADIRRALRRQRLPITHRAMDLLIAGTAIEHGLVLVSRNARDYVDIPSLALYQSA